MASKSFYITLEYLKSILIRITEWWGTLDIPFTLKIGLPIFFVVCLIIYICRRAILLITIILIMLVAAFFFLMGNLPFFMHK